MLQVEAPIFYVDECLNSDLFVQILLNAGFKVARHRDYLDQGVPDEVRTTVELQNFQIFIAAKSS